MTKSGWKTMLPFRAAHTYLAHIREYPPPHPWPSEIFNLFLIVLLENFICIFPSKLSENFINRGGLKMEWYTHKQNSKIQSELLPLWWEQNDAKDCKQKCSCLKKSLKEVTKRESLWASNGTESFWILVSKSLVESSWGCPFLVNGDQILEISCSIWNFYLVWIGLSSSSREKPQDGALLSVNCVLIGISIEYWSGCRSRVSKLI